MLFGMNSQNIMLQVTATTKGREVKETFHVIQHGDIIETFANEEALDAYLDQRGLERMTLKVNDSSHTFKSLSVIDKHGCGC